LEDAGADCPADNVGFGLRHSRFKTQTQLFQITLQLAAQSLDITLGG